MRAASRFPINAPTTAARNYRATISKSFSDVCMRVFFFLKIDAWIYTIVWGLLRVYVWGDEFSHARIKFEIAAATIFV